MNKIIHQKDKKISQIQKENNQLINRHSSDNQNHIELESIIEKTNS